ncbi:MULTISPECIES: RNA polymerase factor sigma-32 [Bartonella]|uniref:RNA polymerase sigma-32 factor n=4 Tax=Bartonella TaxID=773 RepID=E6Z1L1_BARSR|nr:MULTISPECIES: RNA polymerase factor sigma-32 [Bartonella]AQX31391.1 RNA polymerase, sigma 32 subunit, RpoH [Bartonella schoenbuchensis R1]ENN90660.1 RNA polymerase factor sigma-32 [Bartonella schoenbuchensis m07a]MBA9082776.1 RNA polymerase sigma-32 factor [Bartonella chomelii]CBI82999.1 RNA polymerase sigma-32 factor [Bartonella schoenbuchensis R1]CDP79385.1 RNA polymerase factor sigma-32 [Bartonella schoenbuchensis]
MRNLSNAVYKSSKNYSDADKSLGRNMMRSAMQAPYLEKKKEHDLALRWKDKRDDKAMHQIAAAHMRLVISIASRFKRFKMPLSDLVQEGYVGLLEAAARFEPDRDVRFSTYATWWIRASIQDYILRNWSIVRGGTSSSQKALFFNLRRLRAQLVQDDSTMSKQDIFRVISEKLGVSVSDVETMDFRFSGTDNSLSMSVSENDDNSVTKLDTLVDEKPLPDSLIEKVIDGQRRTQWLYDALQILNERELEIIRFRRLNEESATLEFLGEKLGISKERVRQIEARALQKLRCALLNVNPADAYEV